MTTEEIEDVLALLIIRKGGKFANSFGLCKVLSLMFQIIHCNDIIKRIITQNYVEFSLINGIEHFTIMEAGESKLKQEHQIAIEAIKHSFPHQIEILNSLGF